MRSRLVLAFSAMFLAILLPLIAFAQGCPERITLTTSDFVPLECYPASSKFGGLFAGGNDLGAYINTLFVAAISLGAILAVLRLMYAGFLYMGSDMWTSKQKATEIIKDVVLGILLLLSIWIILHQINPNLLKLGVNISTEFKPSPQTVTQTTRDPTIPQNRDLDRILADEDRVRRILQGAGISVNRSKCTVVDQTACTNVGLLPSSAITGLQKLKLNCNCAVQVSGGTEWWLHSSHGPGLPVVDLVKDNAALDRYIKKQGQCVANNKFLRSGQTINACTLDGATYYEEDSRHWHVVY